MAWIELTYLIEFRDVVNEIDDDVGMRDLAYFLFLGVVPPSRLQSCPCDILAALLTGLSILVARRELKGRRKHPELYVVRKGDHIKPPFVGKGRWLPAESLQLGPRDRQWLMVRVDDLQ